MNLSSDPINTLENFIAKNKAKSLSIYLVIVVAVLVFIALLPVIKIEISSQSRCIIRSTTDNVPVSSVVSGKVTFVKLKNNQVVQQGDTLVAITQESLNTDKATNQVAASAIQDQIHDLSKVTKGRATGLKTSVMQQEWLSYSVKKEELQSKVAQAKIVYDRDKQLYDKGIIAKSEFEKYSFDYTYTKQALSSLEKSQRSIWQNNKRELQMQLQNLNRTLQKIKVEAQNYYIVTPLTGTIENFSGIQSGPFLNASQPIATISATDKLIVESSVLPNHFKSYF